MIQIKSPTRVDLAGGTLDMWPLFNFVGGAQTLNLAIDIWTKVSLKSTNSKTIRINSFDLNQSWEFEDLGQMLSALDSKLQLYQSIFSRLKIVSPRLEELGFELETSSESPIGGGLGGSSSLVISILKAFNQYLNLKITDPHEYVKWAHNIEAEVLNTPTGTQDYYPAITGGLSRLEYRFDGVRQTVIDPSNTPLESNFLLVYTGRSHHSGLNNFEVLKSMVSREKNVVASLQKIKIISDKMWEALQTQSWHLLPDLFEQEYSARIQLTPAFTSPEIDRLHQIALSNGADALKICGAGGGGCVLIWVKPEFRNKVIQACENEKFKCLEAKPVKPL